MNIRDFKPNKRIEIWKKDESSENLNELNQKTYEYVLHKKVWGMFVPQTNKAYRASAGTIASETTHKLIIRYQSDIRKDMYLMYNNTRFDITAQPLDPNMAHEFLEIPIKEVVE